MLEFRPASARGRADHGWLRTHHTFSFASYLDPAHMGFSDLRVINEDFVRPGAGFGTHPHRDMEIVTVVLDGALEHRDSMGHGEVLRPGEVQVMSAGRGITHSEFNASDREELHLYQIWIRPREEGVEPRYEQRSFDPKMRRGRWQRVVSPDGADGSLWIHQDASLSLGELAEGEGLEYGFGPGRDGWLQVVQGRVRLQERELSAGDGVGIHAEPEISLEGLAPSSTLMLFDLRG